MAAPPTLRRRRSIGADGRADAFRVEYSVIPTEYVTNTSSRFLKDIGT